MLLLTISLVLIIIAVYAIYRHFKSRSTNTLDSGRRNKKTLAPHFFHRISSLGCPSFIPTAITRASATVSSLRSRQLLTGSLRSVTIAGCFVEVAAARAPLATTVESLGGWFRPLVRH